MKNVLLILAITACATQINAQNVAEKNVPVAVTAAFARSYPAVANAQWNQHGDNFEATYDIDKVDMCITYAPNGNLIKTEMEVPVASLPDGVIEYVYKNYDKEEIKEAKKCTDSKGVVTYAAKVKGEDLIFDNYGNYVMKMES